MGRLKLNQNGSQEVGNDLRFIGRNLENIGKSKDLCGLRWWLLELYSCLPMPNLLC